MTTTDTQSVVDYGMNSTSHDRLVHDAIIYQLGVMRERKEAGTHRASIHEDVNAVVALVKRNSLTKVYFGTETIALVREALFNARPSDEDAPLPAGEIAYGLLYINPKTGVTNDTGFWVDNPKDRDRHLGQLAGEGVYVPIRKVTEYERG